MPGFHFQHTQPSPFASSLCIPHQRCSLGGCGAFFLCRLPETREPRPPPPSPLATDRWQCPLTPGSLCKGGGVGVAVGVLLL